MPAASGFGMASAQIQCLILYTGPMDFDISPPSLLISFQTLEETSGSRYSKLEVDAVERWSENITFLDWSFFFVWFSVL